MQPLRVSRLGAGNSFASQIAGLLALQLGRRTRCSSVFSLHAHRMHYNWFFRARVFQGKVKWASSSNEILGFKEVPKMGKNSEGPSERAG